MAYAEYARNKSGTARLDSRLRGRIYHVRDRSERRSASNTPSRSAAKQQVVIKGTHGTEIPRRITMTTTVYIGRFIDSGPRSSLATPYAVHSASLYSGSGIRRNPCGGTEPDRREYPPSGARGRCCVDRYQCG
ncbi:hypothetical protein C8Q77DRAFT_231952 [Trametes polyzona]|nr:hypothetical protein C8Q77DRAFT_231952 [Trametes polyzona]